MGDKVKRATLGTKHLSDEEWVDFVRGIGDAPPARLRHLEDGCEPCSQGQRVWRAVSAVAAREAAYDPPPAVLRQAEGHYALYGAKGLLKRASRAAALLFDSVQQPLAFGMRSSAPSARLLLYGKAGRVLKLRVLSQIDSEALSLVGQVVDEVEPARKLSDLPVLVQSGRRTVNQTLTNQSGEFALELEPAGSLRLVVGMPGADAIIVALPVTAAVEDES